MRIVSSSTAKLNGLSKVISAVHESQPKLFEKNICFHTEKGRKVELTTVYEDSQSSGSSVGTIVGFHGSPGSHKDFKYIRHQLDEHGIRFIGLNYPGFKYTAGYPGQRFDNVERQRFSDALLDDLDLQGKIVMMGHSRGCENAVITSTDRHPLGMVLINPTGLRIHKGSRPRGKLESLNSLHKNLGKKWGDAVMYQLLKSVGFKVNDGAEAIAVIRSISKMDLERQLEHVLKLNGMSTKMMITFGGNDHLIEKEVIFEKLEKYQGLMHFDFKKTIPSEDHMKILESLKSHKGVSVFVESDNHFQNKKRADLIADSVITMLSSS